MLAFVLLLATASTLPSSLAAEAHLCAGAAADGSGFAAGEAGHRGHHDHPAPGESGGTDGPAHPCTCPHACGPCADGVDPPSVSPVWVFLSQPQVTWTPGWDLSSLPPMDPRRIPTGPDPPATPRS